MRPCMGLHRFRLWTLMLAVAVVGALLGYGVQRARYLRLADLHRIQASRAMADTRPQGLAIRVVRMTPRAVWHLELARKYERVARYPWLPVPPDPPEPQ